MTDSRNNGDLVNKNIGTLHVLEKWESKKSISKSGKQSSRSRYLVLCECGNLRIVFGQYLRAKKEKATCKGCAYKTRPQSLNRQSIWRRIFKLTVGNRRKPNNLSLMDFKKIITSNCHYCGEPPKYKDYLRKNKYAISEIIYANGVDRVNSKYGYSKKNCVPCCSICNSMKLNYTLEQFYTHIEKILKFKKLNNKMKGKSNHD